MTARAPVCLARANAVEVPPGTAWLTEEEARIHDGLRFERRAADWRLGRWVAKGAVAAALGLDGARPEDIEVLAQSSGAPTARLVGERDARPVSMSLSHSGGVGFAAATTDVLGLGCDVETIEARSDEFVSDYFTAAEQRWIADGEDARDARANLLWSAKESALKALGTGLTIDTRSVEVESVAPASADPAGWMALAITVPGGRTFPGLWRVEDGRAWTVVAERAIRVV